MYKYSISYIDYDGNDREEDFFFNLTKGELLQLNFSEKGGLDKLIKKIVAEKDIPKLMEWFKTLIDLSYGEKSLDGKYFIKVRDGHRVVEEFTQTEAYSELYSKLATDADFATEFLNGIIPQNVAAEIAARG